MTADQPVLSDALLNRALRELAAGPEADVFITDVLRTAATTPQEGRLAWPMLALRRSAVLVVVTALLLAALAASAFVFGQMQTRPGPTTAPPQPRRGVTSGFAPEFSYVAPPSEGLRELNDPKMPWFGFEEATGGGGVQPRYGVVVAALSEAVAHECPGNGRVAIRTAPADLLADMQRLGGMTFSDPVASTYDGRPALFTNRVEGSHSCPTADLHIGGACATGCSLVLDYAGSSILLEVDGKTVIIDMWAETSEELASWLPIASDFVYSIHFTSRP
ncbi:MAG: hypothetical protein ABIP53_06490 [Candidatus Limnocylindrales bacterium]